MRFKVDENLPAEAADLLRQAGHDATTVGQQSLSGAVDGRVASVCQDEGRCLVSLDVGFADIRTYAPGQHAGLIVLRLRRQDKPHVLSTLARLMQVFGEENPAGQLWIVDEQRVRARGRD